MSRSPKHLLGRPSVSRSPEHLLSPVWSPFSFKSQRAAWDRAGCPARGHGHAGLREAGISKWTPRPPRGQGPGSTETSLGLRHPKTGH